MSTRPHEILVSIIENSGFNLDVGSIVFKLQWRKKECVVLLLEIRFGSNWAIGERLHYALCNTPTQSSA